ncbi:MAG: monovalent cation:proton antiporter-2 (CPA2) family protein [Pseudomonadota bacterium]
MTDFLLLAFIFLIAGVIAVPIASRLGLGSVLGYLIAGILISPTLNFLGVDVVAVQHFAEFGVVMMLFLVGLELEPKLLWEMRGRLAGLGGGQVAGTAAVIMAVAMFLGETWQVSLAIGLVLALSSTAIVLQSLNEKGLMRSDGGQASFSVLLFQDIAVIPMLALLPLLAIPELAATAEAGHDEGLSLVAGLNAWQTALVTLGAIASVVLGGNYLTRPIFRFIAAARLRELFTAAALMMIIGIALLMSLVGLSPALGTFLAGVVLANSEYRHELESDIEPFKGLLLGLFFMTVGAGINFILLMDNAGPIIALTIGLILAKIIVLLVLAKLFNIPGAHRWLFALGLAQAGEFGFVLLAFTVANGILPTALADKLLLIVALSMLLTPLLFILYDRVIAPRYNREQHREADKIDEISPIIIAGRGRVGGIVDRILDSAGYKSTVIDFSSVQLGRLQKFGINAYFGDATRPDLLRSAGIEEARLLIVAIDDKEQITKLVQYAVHHYPNLHVIARACDRDHVYELWSVGCRDIIRETYDSSLRMGRSAFEAIGISRETADEMVGIFRDADRKSMIEFADVYDLEIPSWENEALIAKVRQLQEEWEPELREQIIAIRNRDGLE